MSAIAKNRTAPNPFLGKKHSKKSKELISKANTGKLVGARNPNFGKTIIFSDETRAKMSKTRKNNPLFRGENHIRATITTETVIEIKKLIAKNIMPTAISKLLNVSVSKIYDIKSGNSWKHVKIEN